MIKNLVKKARQCVCDHEWDVETFPYEGHGIAVVTCSKCGEREEYEFEYEEETESDGE